MNPIAILAITIISEVFGSTMLKKSEGFKKLGASLGVVIGMGIAFYCLSLALRILPIGTVYAIWSGVGTALTTLIGVIIWQEPFNIGTFISLFAIILGVILLNSSSASANEKETSNI
ncbi:QacE family quaternary ammonium compound efflux SMR transporter [Priestia aryabhattai]|uniref:DMT family transporter n=1 Tax=Priestia aryabhattai TaxID=412384 RepID=UPI000B5119BB|nr:multidrug efflux SMR transporter [Priestia aryabhattai]OVE35068.1 QacE family quaternary ammonium compound efflux SMR transporter [Priestia aryabhattai]